MERKFYERFEEFKKENVSKWGKNFDTFAEAFPMRATRLIVTAYNAEWAMHGAISMTGFATSVIACGCEAAIETVLTTDETPDSRPGYLFWYFPCLAKNWQSKSKIELDNVF